MSSSVSQRLTGIAVPPQHQGCRATRCTVAILIIPTASFLAVALLGATPWGRIYQTLRGYGAEEKTARIHLEGIPMPHIDLAVALHAEGAWIRMQVRGKETPAPEHPSTSPSDGTGQGSSAVPRTDAEASSAGVRGAAKESKEVMLTIPLTWKLQEVRGVHIRDVDLRYQIADFRTLVIPYSLLTTNDQLSLEFVFTTTELFDFIAFSPDPPLDSARGKLRAQREVGPALLTLTQVEWPSKEAKRATKIIYGHQIFSLF